MVKVLSIFWIFLVLGLFFYTFTQVDLNLTLSQLSIWQQVQKSLQYIGYFQRPLATLLFLVLVFAFFASYILILKLIKSKKFSKKQIWILVVLSALILGFSYNAFSYDIFNYIFDAKIITEYGMSPYDHRALDFPADPMLPFMRWINRVYPYGPVWLGFTVPLSFIGFQFFLPTFFLFKALMTLSYLGSCYAIYKIVEKTNKKNQLFSLAFFALNPFVLIESLVSAHNDIVMMALLLFSLLFLFKNNILSGTLFVASVGVKFATIFFLPSFLWLLFSKDKEKNWEKAIILGVVTMLIAIIVASLRTNFQPWYLLYVLPVASLISQKKLILIPSVISSFVVLFEYVPYLYTGNWNPPIPTVLGCITLSAVVLSIIGVGLYVIKHKGNLRVIQ